MKTPEKLFLQECNFVAGAATIESLPPFRLPEVAFAGRSNVGKSSLINALLNRNKLARVSQSPGCTAQVNFYQLAESLLLVDLPGYGYARKSRDTLKGWDTLITHYLKGRPTLRRVCLLVDVRRGVGEADITIMKMLDEAAVVYQVVLTKCDTVSKAELEEKTEVVKALGKKHAALHPEVLATSAEEKQGLLALQETIAAFV